MSEYTWFIYAIMAAAAWGLGYVLDERILNSGVSPITLVLIQAIIALPLYLTICGKFGFSTSDFQLIYSDKWILFYTILAALCIVGGNYFILLSLSEKNATLTSIVEISYPLFIVFFSWLLFRESHLNLSVAMGGVLIFSGVIIILRNN